MTTTRAGRGVGIWLGRPCRRRSLRFGLLLATDRVDVDVRGALVWGTCSTSRGIRTRRRVFTVPAAVDVGGGGRRLARARAGQLRPAGPAACWPPRWPWSRCCAPGRPAGRLGVRAASGEPARLGLPRAVRRHRDAVRAAGGRGAARRPLRPRRARPRGRDRPQVLPGAPAARGPSSRHQRATASAGRCSRRCRSRCRSCRSRGTTWRPCVASCSVRRRRGLRLIAVVRAARSLATALAR